ncbi:MAG: hypothetical protein ACLQU3_17315 [Limisphaerales bacterium]
MNRLCVLGLAALALAGCKSNPLSLTISPRVTGRVLAADTGKPLADVKIRSGEQAEALYSASPPKGGERLMARVPVETDSDGRFVLETQRALTPFRGSGWFSVQLSFEHAGYQRFLTNYSYLNLGTNTLNGESVLDAGNIRLQPATK